MQGEKSDEEKKNDLINEKLFKLTSFQSNKGQSPSRQKSIDKSESQKVKKKKKQLNIIYVIMLSLKRKCLLTIWFIPQSDAGLK